MRLGGRLAAAGEVLADAIGRRRPIADALKDWGLSHRFAGSGDRNAIGTIAYDALRRRRSIACCMDADDLAALAEGALYAAWGETPGSLAETLEGDRFAPVLLGGFDPARLEGASPAVRADVPDWCVGEIEASYGADWEAEAAALAARPPLDLRVNALKAERDAVLADLAMERAGPFEPVPEAIRIPPPERDGRQPAVTAEPAHAKGRIEVQDAGSQLVSRLAVPEGGTGQGAGQVMDLCAGGGGKSLALAALMGNRGQVHAYDSDPRRLAPIHDRLKRAGARSVQVHRAGRPDALPGDMDVVLVDAPCTGSGTWRRRPDAKWRTRETALERRTIEQDGVLDHAARLVRPGRRIVYVTCSIFAAENRARVDAFLSRHEGFSRGPVTGIDAAFDAAPQRDDGAGGAMLTPLTTGTDGFYAAVLRREG